jgi:hypothetical protein
VVEWQQVRESTEMTTAARRQGRGIKRTTLEGVTAGLGLARRLVAFGRVVLFPHDNIHTADRFRPR